ncbi:MAG: hypothetical protein KIT43_07710 [Bauldia sp.]|nr:hypothetical protein [Bauldia sp.]
MIVKGPDMQFLRRLSLVDFALIVALVVVGALAISNQRGATTAGGGGLALSNENISAFQDGLVDLFTALATGQPAEAGFEAVATAVGNARDTALAPEVAELAAAHAMRNDPAIAASLARISRLTQTSPFAELFLNAYASGTLNYALQSGGATPATGREWVHLVWIETAPSGALLAWQLAPGEATWSVEPGNAAVTLAFAVPGEGHTGTLRLAPASPGAIVEALATFSAALTESMVALGEPVPLDDGILILDRGEATGARPGQPWIGETRLGEPPGLLDDIRRAEAVVWTATLADGRTFLMRIRMGETGRAAVASVFPA